MLVITLAQLEAGNISEIYQMKLEILFILYTKWKKPLKKNITV